MALRTNYKDDVFTGNRKYQMTQNGDGTVSFTDVTEYTQEGDTYGATQVNDANEYINNLEAKAYKDSDTAETTLANEDYFPFYDASASAKRKTLWSNLVNSLKTSLAIKVHDSTSAGTYGAATSSKFGHAKLSDNYTSSAGTADQSIGASSKAVYDAYRNRAPISHANAQNTYGVGTGSLYGHLKISDAYTSNSGSASDGMAASGKAVNDAYNALGTRIGTSETNITNLTTRIGNDESAINGKAPTSHASSETTYGKGTSSAFGHLKISDNYTSSAGSASNGVAASSKAVNDAYTALGNAKAPNSHASSQTTYGVGSTSAFGHLKISDAYTASAGSAADGISASSKAVYDAYTALNTSITSTLNSAKTYADSVANTAYTNANNNSTARYNEIAGELTANNSRIYMDYKNGKYGINTSSNRSSSTFIPFNLNTIQSGNITFNDTYVIDDGSDRGGTWARMGNVVVVDSWFRPQNITSTFTDYIIASGLPKPVGDCGNFIIWQQDNTNLVIAGGVDINGNLKIRTHSFVIGSDWLNGAFTYVCKN